MGGTTATRSVRTQHREGFGLNQLVELAGVSAPNVHHYRRLGLLPPAPRIGRRFMYDWRHVRALVAIRELRRRYRLSLPVIGTVLPSLIEEVADPPGSDAWNAAVATGLRRAAWPAQPDRLLTAACDVFVRHGLDESNVGEICCAAGIAKGSFYRYFNSKEECFVAAARATACSIRQSLEAATPAADESGLARDTTAELGDLLAPLLPLLLEAVVRALHGHSDYVELVRGVVGEIARPVAVWAGLDDPSAGAGTELLETTLSRVVRARFDMAKP